MLLILTKKNDQSASEVALWLNYYQTPLIRVNIEEANNPVRDIFISNNSLQGHLYYKGTLISLDKITAVWHWHGATKTHLPPNLAYIENLSAKIAIQKHLNKEYTALLTGLYNILESKKNLGNYHNYHINKLEALQAAVQTGLLIPDTLVTTNKTILREFKEKHGQIITKGIQDIFSTRSDNTFFSNYTELVSDELIHSLPDTFYPSLFQECLIKKYELRIFYLNGKFFSSAIFSQAKEQTRIDFRKYDDADPNRIVPFTLPIEISDKLKKLMMRFKLISASIDMVVTTTKQFVFLEINPVGQYGFISDWCNYYLDKQIARYLQLNRS